MKANITFKSVLSKYPNTVKGIEERNEHFNSLDPQSQRLEIAWDALQMVLKEQVFAHYSGYWSEDLQRVEGTSKELQRVFNKQLKSMNCQVCQRGLMMLSQIRLGNDIDSTDSCRRFGNSDNLKGFSLKSMQWMENEFEHCSYGHPYRFNTEEKLANICCNVLVNGDFNIDDKTDYLLP